MELIKDRLRQDDLPLSCVFPAKANFQLGTPDAQGANRPSHSVCDFPITEALLDKGGNQCRIGLALSHVVTGPSCPAPCLSLHTYWKKRFPPFIESYTAWLADLLEPTRVSFESVFTVPPPTYPLGSDARISRHRKKRTYSKVRCVISMAEFGTPKNYDLGCADRLLKSMVSAAAPVRTAKARD